MNNSKKKNKNKFNFNWKIIFCCILTIGALYLYFNVEILNSLFTSVKEVTQIAGNSNNIVNNNNILKMYSNITKCSKILDEII